MLPLSRGRIALLLLWPVWSLGLLGQEVSMGGSDQRILDELISDQYTLPLRHGHVDAITGQVRLKIPLGPRLPGRVPLGFFYHHDSHTKSFTSKGKLNNAELSGGSGAPPQQSNRIVTWSFSIPDWTASNLPLKLRQSLLRTNGGMWSLPSMVSARVHGETWSFYTTWAHANIRYAYTREELSQWGIDDLGEKEAREAAENPLKDGNNADLWPRSTTPEFIVFGRGTTLDGQRTFVCTAWRIPYTQVVRDPSERPENDAVPLQTYHIVGFRPIILYGPNALWTTMKVDVIWPRLDNATYFTTRHNDRVKVSGTDQNTEILNEVTGEKLTYTQTGATDTVTNTFGMASVEILHAPGLDTITTAGSTTRVEYDQTGLPGYLKNITHPNGLKETLTFTPDREGLPLVGCWERSGGSGPTYWKRAYPRAHTLTTSGSGTTQTTRIERTLAVNKTDFETTLVSTYPNAEGTGPFRGVRLVHADRDDAPRLFRQEAIHGVDQQILVDSTTLFDGWGARSGDPADYEYSRQPAGGFKPNLPPLRAFRKRTYVPTRVHPDTTAVAGLTQTVFSREPDAYGTTRTDVWIDVPSEPPAGVSEKKYTEVLNELPTLSPLGVHRTTKVVRAWSRASNSLNTTHQESSLDGPGVALYRGGAATVDGGKKDYTFDDAAFGLVKTSTTTQGTAVATETLTYEPGLPSVRTRLTTLNDGTGPVYANPANPAVQAGKAYTYHPGHHRWQKSETDLATGQTTTYDEVDVFGRPLLITDPTGLQTRRTYDDLGRLATETRLPAGDVPGLLRTLTYDPNGLWKRETLSAEGRTLTTTTYLDAFGRVERVENPDGSVARTTYDLWGQKQSETGPLPQGVTAEAHGATTFTYDRLGRLSETRDPKGQLTTKVLVPRLWQAAPAGSPVPQGFVTRVQDARGYTRTTVEDALGQKRLVIDQAGGQATYHYNRDGHLERTTQGGQSRTYEYDQLGRLRRRTEPEEGTTTFSRFTLGGTPLMRQLVSGARTQTSETVLGPGLLPGTLTSQDSGRSGSLVRSLTYEPVATSWRLKQVQEQQPWGTYTETYDTFDGLQRPTAKTMTDGQRAFTLKRTLDAFGNETTLTYPALGGRPGKVVETKYDGANRPYQVSVGSGLRAIKSYAATTRPSGWSDVVSYGNGTSTQSTLEQGELSRVQILGLRTPSGAAVTEDAAVVWHPGGLLKQRGDDSFEYDPLQRLSWARIRGVIRDDQAGSTAENVEQSFGYDVFGNRTRTTTTWTGGTWGTRPDELYTWSAEPADHVANRLPALITTPSGQQGTGVQYDAFGRITQVLAIPGTPASLTAWEYDPDGRVVTESVGATTTDFLLDAEGLRFRRSSRGSKEVSYTIYGFHREPLTRIKVVLP